MSKDRPILFSGPMVRAILEGRKSQTRRALNRDKLYNGFAFDDPRIARACPYGQPGDRLWVRETFRMPSGWGDHSDPKMLGLGEVYYKADDSFNAGTRWRPSIFMPRCLSRIMLEITGVRVERVQDISEADAIAEGIDHAACGHAYANTIGAYADLWDTINAKRGYSWESNPWIWRVEFKRI